MRRRLLFKLLNNCSVPEAHRAGLPASFYPLYPSSLIHHNYESHCNLLQSLLQLPQSPSALFPAHSVVIALLSVSLSVSSVSVGYHNDSLLWDKPSQQWSSPASPHILFFPIFASRLFPIFPQLWLSALPNSWSLLH